MYRNNKIAIVMYHYVRDLKNSTYPQLKGLDYKLFRQQIEFFHNNFNIITMEEMIAAKYESYDLPENSVLLTFDDGYLDHFTFVFPLLIEYKIQGSFFIPGKVFSEHSILDVNKIHFILASGDIHKLLEEIFKRLDYYRGSEFAFESNEELFKKYAVANRFDSKEVIFIKRILQTLLPEKIRKDVTSYLFEQYIEKNEADFARELYMSKEQIKYMKKNGMYFGIHGYEHYWLGNLETTRVEMDITKSVECMAEYIDTESWVMNYPYGSYNDNVVKFIRSKGCKLGLTTEVGIADISKDTIFTLPRLDTNDFPPKSETYKNYLSGADYGLQQNATF